MQKKAAAHKFRTILGFQKDDVIITKEQSVQWNMKSLFEGENMQTQYSVLGYRIHLYFHDYKLEIEIDENDHSDRNIDYELKRQKLIEQELGCEFIRFDPGKKDIFTAIKEIFKHIKQSSDQLTKKATEKTIIDKFQWDYNV